MKLKKGKISVLKLKDLIKIKGGADEVAVEEITFCVEKWTRVSSEN